MTRRSFLRARPTIHYPVFLAHVLAAGLVLLAACGKDGDGVPAGESATSADAPKPPSRRPASAVRAPVNSPGDPARRDDLYEEALGLVAAKDHARAIKKLERAIAAGPEDARCRLLLGICRSNDKSDVRGAADEFRRAAELAPDDAEPIYLLAVLATEAGEPDEALALAETALARDEGHVPARILRGRVLRESGRVDEAEAELERVLAGAAPADAWYERGKLRLQDGAAAEAVGDLRRAIELDPTDTRAWFNLAAALRRLKREDEARQAQDDFELLRPIFSRSPHDHETDPRARVARLRKILERFPAMWQAHLELARAEMAAAGPSAARVTLEEATRQFPAVVEIRSLLRLVLEHAGDVSGAAREREAIRRLKGEG